MRYGFGVDLGGTTVKLGFLEETGRLIDKWEIPTVTENDGAQILPDIAAAIQEYMTRHDVAPEAVVGVGIGVPGPVDDRGVVNRCINLGWGVFNVAQALGDLVGVPVRAGNDASVAALGECWKGGGQGYGSMVFVTLGTGVGGGIVLGGKPLLGAHGAGGEIGHMVLNRDETELCACGKRGCVEQYCSATGIVTVTKRFLSASSADSCLRRMAKFSCKDVFDAAKAGDGLAVEALEHVFAYMGEFLANVCDVVNPEAVVLGGGVSRAGDFLLDGVRRHFKKNVFHAAANVSFRLATLGNDAGIYGAFKLLL